MADHLGTNGLRFEREGPIGWCHIDRPSARNAFTPAMYYGIKQAVRLVNHDQLRDAALEAAWQVLQTPPDARVHTKRMLNERYGTIDYQTMFWALEHSDEPKEGMLAFMEKRNPRWLPERPA